MCLKKGELFFIRISLSPSLSSMYVDVWKLLLCIIIIHNKKKKFSRGKSWFFPVTYTIQLQPMTLLIFLHLLLLCLLLPTRYIHLCKCHKVKYYKHFFLHEKNPMRANYSSHFSCWMRITYRHKLEAYVGCRKSSFVLGFFCRFHLS